MSIELNPIVQAELELRATLKDAPGEQLAAVLGIVNRAIVAEKLMLGQHEQCGEDNPDGVSKKCACACHKGHYRHAWVPVIKTPQLNPDGTYHLIDRCRYCPDIRFQVIKPAWKDEKHTLVSLEYLIRGEQRVLSKEEWLERAPKAQDMTKIREVGL